MKLIVGLGNPGKQYQQTRHNIGFAIIDLLADKYKVELNNEKFNGQFYKGDGFILAKPLTFMNLSGDFVQAIATFFKIETKDILVIYDDMDMEVGKLRFRSEGSSGGQNGIKDIMAKLGTQEVARLKIGIGRPEREGVEHVLGKFTSEEKEIIASKKNEIIKAVEEFINK